MSRSTCFVAMMFAAGSAFPAAAESMPTAANCSGLDESTYEIDANLRMDDNDIVFARGVDEAARLTRDYRLLVDGDDVELNTAGRAALVGYVVTFDNLVEEAKAIGIEGARLGTYAAAGAVRAIFSSESRAEFEEDVEARAAALEARADALCETVHRLRGYHVALAEASPEFAAAVPLKD